MWPLFEKSLARYRELEAQLADPDLAADRLRYTRLAKEHGTLARQVKPYVEYKTLADDIAGGDALLAAETDPEMREYAAAELAALREREKALVERLEDFVLADGDSFDSIIVEIRAGTGGDEAALFAGDLYEMYTRYAREQGWRVEDIAFSAGEAGGFKDVTFSVTGGEAFQCLRYESGGHRVQRVPRTETQGRIHTSAATVAILAEPDETQVEIRPQDIVREVMRAGGAGGQHVNKTESAVRLWYKKGTPDELEVKCQDERSQHKNEAQAMRVLRGRLFERERQRLHQLRAEQRRTLIGSGDRGDRVRTYNFPQSRITDHRINVNLHNLEAVLAGDLSELVRALRDFDKRQRLGVAAGAAGAG